jgi:putative flavoprotein involved in K+ transport
MWFVFSHVLSVNNPIGRKVRSELLNKGLPVARVRPADLEQVGVERVHARTVRAQDGRPVLEDGRVLDVANVVWCSGFRSNFSWIDLPIFDDNGEPLHERGIVPAAPGLYFVGLFFLSAATSSLVGGVGKDAARIAGHIANRSSVKQPDFPEHAEVEGSKLSV